MHGVIPSKQEYPLFADQRFSAGGNSMLPLNTALKMFSWQG